MSSDRKPEPQDHDLVTTAEAAVILNCTARHVRGLASRNQLPVVAIVGPNQQRLFRRQDLEQRARERGR